MNWCRLDYGNGTLVGLPAYLVHRLQSVQNAMLRLVFRLRRSDHINYAASIGCERNKGLVTPCRLIGSPWPCPAVPCGSSHRSPTSSLDKIAVFISVHLTIYSFLLSDCLLLDVAPSLSQLSPALAYGTTCRLMMSPQQSAPSAPGHFLMRSDTQNVQW